MGGCEDEYSRCSDSANKTTSGKIKMQVIGRLNRLHSHSSFLNLSNENGMSGVFTKYYTRNEKSNNKPLVNTKNAKYDTEDNLKATIYAAQKVKCCLFAP
jgi:hypothetical protein